MQEPDEVPAQDAWSSVTAVSAAKWLAARAGALSAVLFALGWVFTTVFYGRLGVDASQAGVDAEWVGTRATACAIVLVGITGVTLAVPLHYERSHGRRTTLMLLAAAAVVAAGTDATLAFDLPVGVYRIFGLGALSVGVLWLPAAGLVRLLAKRPTAGAVPQLALPTAAALMAVSVIALPWVAAGRFADAVERGRAVRVDFGIGLQLLAVAPSSVYLQDPLHAVRDGDCVTALGASGSRTFLYVHRLHRAIEVPNDLTLVPRSSRSCSRPAVQHR